MKRFMNDSTNHDVKLGMLEAEEEKRRPQEKSAIRADLQGLRGWAVLAVVIFHFFPEQLPRGFLGVDVFFVLSGFLIALVLHNRSAHEFRSYWQFYFRRCRRIFPLLLLIVLFVSIYNTLRYTGPRLDYQKRSAYYALSFTSNIKQTDAGEQYFLKLVDAEDFLTHTWSLAVEVQFYVIAPFLLLVGKKVTGGTCRNMLLYLFVVGLSSFLFHAFADPSTAFNNVFARLWQFLLGALVFNALTLTRSDDREKAHKHKFIWWIAILCALLLSFFINFESVVLPRFLVTVVAAATIFLETTSPILTHKTMVMLGDCSYSLYLIHWPAVCLLKEGNIDSVNGKLLTVAVCAAISHYCYLHYERWYLKLGERATMLLIVALYAANLLAVQQPEFSMPKFVGDDAPPSSLQPATILVVDKKPAVTQPYTPPQWNHSATTSGPPPKTKTMLVEWLSDPYGNWTLHDYAGIPPDVVSGINARVNERMLTNYMIPNCTFLTTLGPNPFGLCRAPNGTGNHSFLVIGNSYAASHARLMLQHFRPHYSTLHFHCRASCLAINDGSNAHDKYCKPAEEPIHVVKQLKPDVLFAIQRFLVLSQPLVGDIEKDAQFSEFFNVTEEMAKYAKKIFIMDALPVSYAQQAPIIRSGATFLSEGVVRSADPIRRRMVEVAKRCSNCILFDTLNSHLINNGSYMVIDMHSGVRMFENLWHHTPYGLKVIEEPVFEKLAANFSLLLNASAPFNTFNVAN